MRKLILLCAVLLAAFAAGAQPLLSESFNVTSATNSLPTGWVVSSIGTTTGCNGTDWMQVPSGGFVCSVNGTPQPSPSGQSGSGMAGYNSWDIDLGSTSTMVTPVLNFSALGSYTLSFWVYNQNGLISNAHDSLKVYVNTAPGIGGTLLYANDPNYNSSPAGWAQYTFSIPTTYTGTTNYIVFQAKSNWGQDIFIDDVVVDHIPPTPCSGTPLTPTVGNAAIITPLCQNSTITLNGVDPNLPTTSGISHQWESAASATGPWAPVTGGSGATTLSYTTGPLTAGTYFRIGSTCSASAVTAYSAAFFVPVGAPQPGTISGSSIFCPGDALTYSVPSVSGTTYAWTFPAGWSGSSTGNSILVTPGSASGTVSVTATTSCGTSIPQTMSVFPGNAPASAGSILGNGNICPGSTETYSVIAVADATSYLWTLPSGWTGSSTTNSITVTANSNPGNVSVRPVNGCGQGPATVMAVSIITALNSPGTITGPDTVCSGTLQAYSINPVPGATSYTWILPSGWSGTTTGTSIQAFAGSTGGVLSVTAHVACATSPVSDTLTTVRPTVNPSVTVSAPAGTLCQNRPISFTATPTHPGNSPSYQWMVNSLPVTSLGSVYTTSTMKPGDTISVILTSDAVCAANTVAISNQLIPVITPSEAPGVSINTVPPIAICQGTPVTFSTIVTGGGPSPAYQWFKNASPIPGATRPSYTDAGLHHGDTLTVDMTSSATCPSFRTATSNKVGVHVDAPLVASVSIAVSPSEIITPGQYVTFTATQSNGGATPDYQWIKNGVIIPRETGDTYTSNTLKAGDAISVRMLSYENCVSVPLVSSNVIALKAPLGTGGPGMAAAGVRMYPNPTRGQFTLSIADAAAFSSGRPLRVEVVSTVGQSVYHLDQQPVNGATGWQMNVDLGTVLPDGNYVLRVRTAEGAQIAALPFVLSR